VSYPGGAPVTIVGGQNGGAGSGTAANPTVTTQSAPTYTLSNGATSTGSQTPAAGSYRLNTPSAFNGATLTITSTSSNGTTGTATYTSAPSVPPEYDIYSGTTINAAWSGGTPNGNVTLSGGPTVVGGSALPTYPTYQAVAPTPVSTTVSNTTQTDSAAFTPQLGRPVNVLITGTWAGTVQVLRSLDGGTTRNPITAAGTPYGRFTANAQEAVGSDSDPAATYYLRFMLTSGSATGSIR
jgi:hypothetical protein